MSKEVCLVKYNLKIQEVDYLKESLKQSQNQINDLQIN